MLSVDEIRMVKTLAHLQSEIDAISRMSDTKLVDWIGRNGRNGPKLLTTLRHSEKDARFLASNLSPADAGLALLCNQVALNAASTADRINTIMGRISHLPPTNVALLLVYFVMLSSMAVAAISQSPLIAFGYAALASATAVLGVRLRYRPTTQTSAAG